MKKIYIILTRTNTFLSRIISFVKNDEYTHASISLDESFEEMYSFGRKYTYNPFIGAFVKESFNKGIFGIHENLHGIIMEIQVTDKQYRAAKKMISKFIVNRSSYSYNYLGLVCGLFNKEVFFERSFLCSEFVYYILNSSTIVDLNMHRSLVRPQDLLNLNGEIIYEGNLKNINTCFLPEYSVKDAVVI